MELHEIEHLILQREIEIPKYEQDKFPHEPETSPEGKRNPKTAELVFDTLKKIFDEFHQKYPVLRSPF